MMRSEQNDGLISGQIRCEQFEIANVHPFADCRGRHVRALHNFSNHVERIVVRLSGDTLNFGVRLVGKRTAQIIEG